MASDIVQEAFEEWTKGLGGKDVRISIFDHIRDIPYAVIPEIRNPVDGPQGLLKGMKGSCTPKHFLLGRMFEMLQIPIKYTTYPFSWNAESVAYPPELRKLAEVALLTITWRARRKSKTNGRLSTPHGIGRSPV